jgi:putative heme iron utilization protein
MRYGPGTPRERHLRFLEALQAHTAEVPTCSIIMGDFNQQIPRKYQRPLIFETLDRAVLRRFTTATAGIIKGIDKQAMDHICHS